MENAFLTKALCNKCVLLDNNNKARLHKHTHNVFAVFLSRSSTKASQMRLSQQTVTVLLQSDRDSRKDILTSMSWLVFHLRITEDLSYACRKAVWSISDHVRPEIFKITETFGCQILSH